MRLPIIVCSLCLAGANAWSADLTWTGTSVNKLWSETINWTPAQLPSAADRIIFGDQGAVTNESLTSMMDLVTEIDQLSFVNNTGLIHRLDLDGTTLRILDAFDASINQVNQDTRVTIANGPVVIGVETNRATHVRVGYFDSGSAGEQHANLRMDVNGFDAWINDVEIGRRTVGTGVELDPVFDFSASGDLRLDAANYIYIGTVTGNGSGQNVSGTLHLPTNQVSILRTPQLWIGDSPGQGNQSATSSLTLGLTTHIEADEIALGRFKSRGQMIPAADINPTVNISGLSGSAANLFLGYNALGTGTHAQGTLDVGGGTLNAVLDQVEIGRHNNGNGSGKGRILMGDGDVTANNLFMARTDIGGSTGNDALTTGLFQMSGGSLTVTNGLIDGNGVSRLAIFAGDVSIGGDLSVDDLDLGYNEGLGTLSVSGSVRIGTGSESLEWGRRDRLNSAGGNAEIDFSAAPRVDINVANIHLGNINQNGPANVNGVLDLSRNGPNTVSANLWRIGDSNPPGNTGVLSEVHLGASTNRLNVNTLYVGQRKSRALMDQLTGGSTIIRGRTGGLANLRVGYNNARTASQSEGMFDMSGGLLDARFGEVTLGFHSTSTGNGRGTFIMDGGTVEADRVVLSRPSAGGTPSTNPQNSQGTLQVNGGNFNVRGEVVDLGGTSLLEVNDGTFNVRNNFILDTVSVDTPTGGVAVLSLNAYPGATWRVGQYSQGANATLQLNYSDTNPVFEATSATFANGSFIEFGALDHGMPLTNRLDAVTWRGGTNEWDDLAHNRWSLYVPAGITFQPTNTVDILIATNLVDNGVSSSNPDITLSVTPGVNGRISASYAGPPLTSGQRGAILDTPSSVITRNGDLLLGDTPASGAGATGVEMTGGNLTVSGGVPHDGGKNYFILDGGTVTVQNGGFEVDAFRLGYLNRTGILQVNGGPVRIGDPASPAVLDIARRIGNPSPSALNIGIADFTNTTGARVFATDLRLGTSNNANGPAAQGQLILANAGTNFISAVRIFVADSPLQGQGAEGGPSSPESLIQFGASTNVVETDLLTIGYRKSIGRVAVSDGGVLELTGKNGSSTELRLGFNEVNTGTTSVGTLDARNATLNATLGIVSIGRHNLGAGAGQGTFLMGGGAVTATRLDLARVNVGGVSANAANTRAWLELNGGLLDVQGAVQDMGGSSTVIIDGAELRAASVDDLDTLELLDGSLRTGALTGSPTFSMSGGRLAADQVSFSVSATGGTIAPGNSVGRSLFEQDLSLDNTGFEIELETGTNDFVEVTGQLTLGPSARLDVLALAQPASDTLVIARYGTLVGTFSTENLPAGWSVDYAYQTNHIALISSSGPPFSLQPSVQVNNNQATIRWDSLPGSTYSVWRTESLQIIDWQRIVSGIGATPPLNQFTDPNASGIRAYYRIERE